MAYVTGTAANPTALISALCDFLNANGGVGQMVLSAPGTNQRYLMDMTLPTPSNAAGFQIYLVSRIDNKGIFGRAGNQVIAPSSLNVDVNTNLGWQQYATQMTTWDFTGPYVGYYFFYHSYCCHIVVEIANGIYNHMSFGTVSNWTGGGAGGGYMTGGYYMYKPSGNFSDWTSSYHDRPFNDSAHSNLGTVYSYLRHKFTGTGFNDYKPMDGGYNNSSGMFVGMAGSHDNDSSIYNNVMANAPSKFTNRTPLFPGLVRRYDYEDNSGLCSIAGMVPNVAFLKMTPDMNAKDIINTDWQVFPITMRTGGDTTVASNSGEYALAYRRI